MPQDIGGQIRMMAENLLTTGLTSLTSSPINPIFPLSNLTTSFRGRPVKFAGRFLINATNQNIYLNDGTNKTAVIAIADYASRTAFASAVQSALNAVSSGFTVVWNSTFQSFVIGRSGVWTFRLSQTTNAAHVALGFTGSTDLTGATTYTADRKRFHWPYEYIAIDFGYFPSIGFLGLVSDSRYIFALTEMANVRIQANTLPDFSAPPLDRALTITEKGIFEFFDDDDYNYRYWRLTIEDNTNNDDPKIGFMYLGEFEKFLVSDEYRYNDQGAENYKLDSSEKAVSEAGQVYSIRKQTQMVYDSIVLQMLDPIAKDFLNDIWVRYTNTEPFFISVDPKLEISQKLSDYTFLCNFISEPRFAHRSGNRYNTRFGVNEWL